ncbi:MAG: esterase family protein [Chloroflexi bacterium]|nr:esterase family protein [Chloroflexota bacterium]
MSPTTASRVVFEQFTSQALADNPLGDPSTRTVPVYLPPGYDQEPDRRYPVIYILAGFGSRGLALLNDFLWEENIQQRLDRLIAQGDLPPVIAVLPDASTRYGGSQYLNSSALGRYEDHILELVEAIDARYRTLPDPAHRAIMGHSSGGYGAITLAMKHPDRFGLVADHAGDKYFELAYQPDFPKLLRFFLQHGWEGVRALLADPGAYQPKDGLFFATLNLLAMSAAYSPNPYAELGFDLPLDPETGALRPEVWARWQAHDPIHLVGVYREALASLRFLYLDCGLYDEYNLLYGARQMNQRLTAYGIAHVYEEFPGGHRGTKYRFDVSLRLMGALWKDEGL